MAEPIQMRWGAMRKSLRFFEDEFAHVNAVVAFAMGKAGSARPKNKKKSQAAHASLENPYFFLDSITKAHARSPLKDLDVVLMENNESDGKTTAEFLLGGATPRLSEMMPKSAEEIFCAFFDILDLGHHEWRSLRERSYGMGLALR